MPRPTQSRGTGSHEPEEVRLTLWGTLDGWQNSLLKFQSSISLWMFFLPLLHSMEEEKGKDLNESQSHSHRQHRTTAVFTENGTHFTEVL